MADACVWSLSNWLTREKPRIEWGKFLVCCLACFPLCVVLNDAIYWNALNWLWRGAATHSMLERDKATHTQTQTQRTPYVSSESFRFGIHLDGALQGRAKSAAEQHIRAQCKWWKKKKMMEWSTALLLCHHMPDTNCGDDVCRWVHVCVCVWWWWALRRTWLAPTWLPTSQLAELENCCFYFCYTRLKCLHIYIIFICSLLIPNRMPWQPCCLLVLNHLANLFRLIPLFTPKYEGIIYSMSLWSIF